MFDEFLLNVDLGKFLTGIERPLGLSSSRVGLIFWIGLLGIYRNSISFYNGIECFNAEYLIFKDFCTYFCGLSLLIEEDYILYDKLSIKTDFFVIIEIFLFVFYCRFFWLPNLIND